MMSLEEGYSHNLLNDNMRLAQHVNILAQPTVNFGVEVNDSPLSGLLSKVAKQSGSLTYSSMV